MNIYFGANHTEKRLKVTIDRDCLPTDIHNFYEVLSTADENDRAQLRERFWKVYEETRLIENAMGYHLCIDFGWIYYETGVGFLYTGNRSINEQLREHAYTPID